MANPRNRHVPIPAGTYEFWEQLREKLGLISVTQTFVEAARIGVAALCGCDEPDGCEICARLRVMTTHKPRINWWKAQGQGQHYGSRQQTIRKSKAVRRIGEDRT